MKGNYKYTEQYRYGSLDDESAFTRMKKDPPDKPGDDTIELLHDEIRRRDPSRSADASVRDDKKHTSFRDDRSVQ